MEHDPNATKVRRRYLSKLQRRITKATRGEIAELDYFDKLSDDEKKYVMQFYLEYYQADFNWDKVLHKPEHRKECRDRNNSTKRQIHSVGVDLLAKSQLKIINTGPKNFHNYYLPGDYNTDLPRALDLSPPESTQSNEMGTLGPLSPPLEDDDEAV